MRIFGLDLGIASVGWSVLEVVIAHSSENMSGHIRATGTWMFDPPEERVNGILKIKNQARRGFRGLRRVIKRRRQRMNEVRRILAEDGLLPDDGKHALAVAGADPWRLRVKGLSHALTPLELAIALGHIAKHRGFKSNAKGQKKNSLNEDGRMKASMDKTQEKLACYTTPALMFAKDADYILRETVKKDGSLEQVRRFRNREGEYSRSLTRTDLESETRELFKAQRRLGQNHASPQLEHAFINIAFFQRPLQNSESMLGECPFELGQKRAASRAPSFELFRLLSRLNTLKVIEGQQQPRSLTPTEIGSAIADFGATAKLSFAALRKKIKLSSDQRFGGVKFEDEAKHDVVARSGETATGTAKLRKLICANHGEITWQSLWSHQELLDQIAQVVSFREDMEHIRSGLSEIAIDPAIRTTMENAAAIGEFEKFTGAGHISAKAARAIIPGLLQGLTYDKACRLANYDHTASRERHAFDVRHSDGERLFGKEALARILKEERVSASLIGSPTVRKALIEALKQVKALIEEYGLPDRIHVEMARDVGKSVDERLEIERGIKKRNRQKDKIRQNFTDKLGREPRNAEELLRFELWEQQNCRCLYTDDYISPDRLLDGNNTVQVDHILPWSRFGDDSFHNKSLCTTKANQDKKGRTPFEWFIEDKSPQDWEAFEARIREIPYMKGLKRRNYLLRNAAEVEERFRDSNLNDTRWACRILAEALNQVLPPELDEKGKARRRVFARPGALTDRLRRAWHLQWLKKDEKGERIADDRHHALDAIIVAATTESLLNRATREIQLLEAQGNKNGDLLKNIDQPWEGFREQTLSAVGSVIVARASRHRARGKAHKETTLQLVDVDGEKKTYRRTSIDALNLSDLDLIKDPDRNAAIIASLRVWIEAKKPKDLASQPLSPKGDPIRKINIQTKDKANVLLYRGGHNNPAGTAGNERMPRVDVFCKENKKGVREFFLIPVYVAEIAMLKNPPMRAVTARKPPEEWPLIDDSYSFLFSLVPMSLVKIIDRGGAVIFPDQADGNLCYFRRFDTNTGAITISSLASPFVTYRVGTRWLHTFQKMTVDRFGRVFEVTKETRRWHGKACI